MKKFFLILTLFFTLSLQATVYDDINAMTVENSIYSLLGKYWPENNYVFDEIREDETRTNYQRLMPPKPTLEELDAKLILYKAELTANEDARLAEIARVTGLKNRWKALGDDPNILVWRKYPTVSNALLKFNKILAPDKAAEAETLMVELEVEKVIYDNELVVIQTAADTRSDDIDQAILAIDLINASDKPVWEKKLLIRLIKEIKK